MKPENFKLANPKLEELKEKLVQLYYGVQDCSNYVLMFNRLFGKMSAKKFRALTKAYNEFALIVDNEKFIHFHKDEEEPEKNDSEMLRILTEAVQNFSEIFETEDA